MRSKKISTMKMTRKRAIVICIVALIIGAFEIYVVNGYLQATKNEMAVQRIYQIEENDAKKYNIGIRAQKKEFNDAEVTVYYSMNEHGEVIRTIQEQLDQLISEQQTKNQLVAHSLNFFKPIRQSSDFPGLDKVVLYQSSYMIQDGKVEQTVFAKLQQFYLTQTDEIVNNTALFRDVDAAKQVLLEQINLAMDSGGATSQQKEVIYNEMHQLPFEKWDIDYQSGHLIVALPDNPLPLAEVSVLMSHLYASIKSEYLSETDLATYEQYVAQQNVVASASSNDIEPITQKHEQGSGKKLVAITFDDGPDEILTVRALDILAQYQAKATFFMLGSKVEGQEAIIQRMVAEGHELGNHTWGHPELTKLSAENITREYISTQEAIAKASNGVVPKLLRPPYGAFNNAVDALIDVPLVMWSIDTLDWQNRDTASILSEVQKQVFDGGIILMHDIHPTSIDALPAVLQFLRSEGYQLVTVSELHAQYGLSEDVYIQ